jgi:SLT domain-containing protein
VKVQAKQAMTQPKAMTLPEIAVEVQRITKEKEVLAQKVQVYVATHPRTATMATAGITTTSIAVSTVEASAKIAEIKKEIADLTDKLLAQKTAANTVAANPTQTTNTAETAVPVETPVQQPSGTVKTDTTAPSQVTPEITITPEGDVAKNGQVQTVPISQDSSKKGLFQSITDYFKSLFKF